MLYFEVLFSILVKGCLLDILKVFWRVVVLLYDMLFKRLIVVWILFVVVVIDSLENIWVGFFCWMFLFFNFKIDLKVVFCIFFF